MKSVLGDRRAIAILLGPALLVYTLAMLVPVVWSLGYTFFKGNALEGFRFAGFDNFARLAADPDVHEAFAFTVKYAALMSLGQVVVGYALALFYVFVLRRLSSFVRTLVFFPVVIPTVAIALLYQKLFQSAPRDGVVNELLVNVGLVSAASTGSARAAPRSS